MTFGVVLVTGVAGFVGSTLSEHLLDLGVKVRGLDCMTPYYSSEVKRANLAHLTSRKGFEFWAVDLSSDELTSHLDEIEVVFHQAAQPGVRSSWADGFPTSVTNNVTATQRLLEASRVAGVERFVYASSSSVYGNVGNGPMREDAHLRPYSPYGVTKLSAEQLCSVYADNWGLRTVSLRYFTVYGPRQRPDMATHRLMQSALQGSEFPLYGSTDHVRDFTYVDDIVEANVAAATAGNLEPGSVMNIAGGTIVSIQELMAAVEEVSGKRLNVVYEGAKAGDVLHTEADLSRSRELLSWSPKVGLREGLYRQMRWHQENEELLSAAS